MSRSALPAAGLVAAMALTGCQGPCLDQGVSWGVMLNVTNAQPGTHRAEAEVADGTLSLELDVAADGEVSCVRCEATTARFSFSHEVYSYPRLMLNLAEVGRARGPEVFQLRVFRDDVNLFDEEIRPSYRTSEPNGEGCGETSSATLEINLP